MACDVGNTPSAHSQDCRIKGPMLELSLSLRLCQPAQHDVCDPSSHQKSRQNAKLQLFFDESVFLGGPTPCATVLQQQGACL